jgi:tetratricopeptide (TPR) repeat protein
LDGRNAKAYNVRGNILFNLGDTHKALDNYSKAIKINPNYADAYINRGFTYENL